MEIIYIGSVLLAGLLSFFSPCVVPLLPVYFSLFSTDLECPENGKRSRKKVLLLKTFLFVLGISTCFVILGFGIGALGGLINSKSFMVLIGIIVIILGIHQTGLVPIKYLYREKTLQIKDSSSSGFLSVFLLGFTFSFGWTPCIGPVLGAVLGVAAGGGQALMGGLMMAVYSLGFMVPFMLIALFSDVLLNRIKGINKHLGKIKIAGGVIIIIMGILLMTDSLNFLFYTGNIV